MIYIVVALKAEAQAFVDKYKLHKITIGSYKAFQNTQFIVIISGMGVHNSMLATQTLIDTFDIRDEDIFLNVGICGANREYSIGELLVISEILYKGKSYVLSDMKSRTITCVDEPIKDKRYQIVDMESFGFYEAVNHSPAIKQKYIFKVVSDHFEPENVTKERAKSLLFNQIDGIKSIINRKGEF